MLEEAATNSSCENWLKWGQAIGFVATPEEQPVELKEPAPVAAFKLGDRLFDKAGKEV